jgi:hypothetical protein
MSIKLKIIIIRKVILINFNKNQYNIKDRKIVGKLKAKKFKKYS